ncbi:MAG: hypothetical protein NTY19_31495 [Planctomycetota bacterium]|nr:hypothetical protein [Planctomycetota bacterium]
MPPFQNHFTKAHLFVFLGIWLGFTALTYWIAEHGIEQDSHRRLVILTTLGTILGPMTGAISRNCQSCCLAFSLSLLPYCGAFMVGGTLPLFIKLPFSRGASALRMVLWVMGLLGWFLSGIVSHGHALN